MEFKGGSNEKDSLSSTFHTSITSCGEKSYSCPRLLSLEGLLAKLSLGWQWGTWVREGFSPFPGKSGSLCLNCPNSMIHAERLPSSRESEFWYMADRRAYVASTPSLLPPIRIMGTESLMSFPRKQHFTCVRTAHCWGVRCVLCDFTGARLLEAGPALHLDVAPCPFVFDDFSLYLFAGINHSHEYDCVLSPVSLPGIGLWDPETPPNLFFFSCTTLKPE